MSGGTKVDYPGSPCWHCGSTKHDTAGHPRDKNGHVISGEERSTGKARPQLSFDECSYCGTPCVPNTVACKDCVTKFLVGPDARLPSVGALRVRQLEDALREVNSFQHQMAIELDPIPAQPRVEYWTRKIEDVCCAALGATPKDTTAPATGGGPRTNE